LTTVLIPFVGELAALVLLANFIGLSLFLSVIDVYTRRVPNTTVYAGALLLIMGSALMGPGHMVEALIGGALTLIATLIVAILRPAGLGMGDVKFACLIGIGLGWHFGLLAIALAFVIGAAVMTPALLLRLVTIRDSVAFTPFLTLGAIAVVLVAGVP
jgi:leader peptidase (prepilin peptidase) / N-methyltransferase